MGKQCDRINFSMGQDAMWLDCDVHKRGRLTTLKLCKQTQYFKYAMTAILVCRGEGSKVGCRGRGA